ncbi:MAG: tetratricopeptide repeat protein [Nitrospiraceae bacterium]|nr:tetratricopeptide repeat protein [Nitrospirota bacterium]MDA8337791.1 tetratricopeptide repeat protein [Nitrospiraceae bacterium]
MQGNSYFQKNQYDLAIEDYNKAIILEPFHFEAYGNRGNAYKRKKQYDRALEDYNKAIDIEPQNAIDHYNKACLYSEMNNAEEACKWLKRSVEKGFNNWNHIKTDRDLDNIRSAPCYKEVVAGKGTN